MYDHIALHHAPLTPCRVRRVCRAQRVRDSQPYAESVTLSNAKNDGLRLEHAIARNLCKVTSPINPSDARLGVWTAICETRGEVETSRAAESGEMPAVTQIICRDSSKVMKQRRSMMVPRRDEVIHQNPTRIKFEIKDQLVTVVGA